MKKKRKNLSSTGNFSIQNAISILQGSILYQLLMALLALLSGGMLLYEFFGNNVSEETISLMDKLDLSIAYVFLTDFCVSVLFAGKKLLYIKQNWLDLISSIPLSDGLFRVLRIARFIRLVRLLRVANTGLNIEDSIKDIYKNRKDH
ncbi:MAG: ion transporter [Candidatus Spechtbacterales bacterium]